MMIRLSDAGLEMDLRMDKCINRWFIIPTITLCIGGVNHNTWGRHLGGMELIWLNRRLYLSLFTKPCR